MTPSKMIQRILYKLIKYGLSYTTQYQNGKVTVSGWSRGIDQVEFEGNNAVLGFCNFNGNIKVGYATTFSMHNLIHGDVRIGRYCQFGPYGSVNTYNHPYRHLTTYINQRLLKGKMTNYKTSNPSTIGNSDIDNSRLFDSFPVRPLSRYQRFIGKVLYRIFVVKFNRLFLKRLGLPANY